MQAQQVAVVREDGVAAMAATVGAASMSATSCIGVEADADGEAEAEVVPVSGALAARVGEHVREHGLAAFAARPDVQAFIRHVPRQGIRSGVRFAASRDALHEREFAVVARPPALGLHAHDVAPTILTTG